MLGIFHTPITHILYDGRFDADSSLLWLIGLQPVFAGLFGVYHAVLESQQRPDYVFYASLVSAMVSITIGVLLTAKFGLAGVACSSAIALALNFLVAWALSRRLARRSSAEQHSPDQGADMPAHVPLGAEEL